MPRRRRSVVLPIAGLLLVALGACSDADGRELPPPGSHQTTTSSSAPVIQPPTGDLGAFTLESAAFGDGDPIPNAFTCNGEDLSPALSWSGTPADALELAIVMRDRDADGFVHWVVTGIDPFVLGFAASQLPENAVEQRNGAGTIGWLGPCPSAGSGTHTYELILHALPARLAISADATAEEAARTVESTSTSGAVLTGTVTAGPG